MINNVKLPDTDITAEIAFNSRDDANKFAKMYTRKTLMGHVITGSTVKVFNVTDEIKDFINDYIKTNFNQI
jgi:hypothetical protein